MVAINSDRFDTMFSCTCRGCNTEYIVFLKIDDYCDWLDGKGLIQDILPYLSAGERELFITGLCGNCFDSLLAGD